MYSTCLFSFWRACAGSAEGLFSSITKLVISECFVKKKRKTTYFFTRRKILTTKNNLSFWLLLVKFSHTLIYSRIFSPLTNNNKWTSCNNRQTPIIRTPAQTRILSWFIISRLNKNLSLFAAMSRDESRKIKDLLNHKQRNRRQASRL